MSFNNGDTGGIVELNDNRYVYSAINKPNDLLFNKDNRLCFLESDENLLHCGDSIYYIHGGIKCHLKGLIEDLDLGGYWIGQNYNYADRSDLVFVNYNGEILKRVPVKGKINQILEARGNLRS